MPRIPLLSHSHKRGIDSTVTVRVISLHRFADDTGALRGGRTGRKIQVVHGDQNATLRRLKAVAYVGKRTTDDHAHRVRKVALLELFFDRHKQQTTVVAVAIIRFLWTIWRRRIRGQIRVLSVYNGDQKVLRQATDGE